MNSIERLNLTFRRRFWLTLHLKGFSFRHQPLVCPLNDLRFLVAGGTDGYSGYFLDSLAVRPDAFVARKINTQNWLGFTCLRNTVTNGANGEVFSVVEDEELEIHVMHFSPVSNMLLSIEHLVTQE